MKLKNLFFLATIGLFISFTSCKPNEEVDTPTTIVGTWSFVKQEATVETNNVAATAAIKYAVEHRSNPDGSDIKYTFSNDGKITVSAVFNEKTYIEEGVYEIKEGNLILKESIDSQELMSYPYTLSKNELRMENTKNYSIQDSEYLLSSLKLDSSIKVTKIKAELVFTKK